MVTQGKNNLLPPYGDNHCFFSSDIHEKFWIPRHQKPCHALGNALVLSDDSVYGIFLTKINEICRYMIDWMTVFGCRRRTFSTRIETSRTDFFRPAGDMLDTMTYDLVSGPQF